MLSTKMIKRFHFFSFTKSQIDGSLDPMLCFLYVCHIIVAYLSIFFMLLVFNSSSF